MRDSDYLCISMQITANRNISKVRYFKYMFSLDVIAWMSTKSYHVIFAHGYGHWKQESLYTVRETKVFESIYDLAENFLSQY
jgi:hypothetical protein